MIEGKDLRVYFKSRDIVVKALDGVNVSVKDREIVGIVGESGSGKTTLGRTILNLQKPLSGEVLWNGKNVFKLKGKEEKEFRRQNQIIYQNPYEAVDIRLKVYDIVAEGLRVHNIPKDKEEESKIVMETLRDVGLTPEDEYAKSLPNQLSGGQLQRVAIARALVLNPSFIVADEPVSMLDMSIRAGVLDIFKRLRDERGISIMMITHDISTLGYVADRIYVMYQGKVIEHGSTDAVLDKPLHPYTQALISAVPIPDPSGRTSLFSIKVKEEMEPYNGKGCRYYPRCPFAMASCREKEPNLSGVSSDHYVACFLY
ncbi:putative ABC transporter ATP-binding protein [Metallosphaera sp. J1]|uniref:ABC transporter ATP-binding protein n=1 Tax=Metallosphaera TaxID=41980 RepID=UPI001EDCE2E1|nr:ABC transporter ATP-binding protein [Metallosphaera javensis (ex Hofmann et al. 2022)]MCG3109030.1 putative ABC transporter ATP-binding protein [Metallosphaera javensis (ex Hofmann et al. 2022)]BCS92553.1 MAG: ABC transporter ATP-binding protein [Metallosphaera javensis (ex Sakai et al. 2022)]